MTHKKQTKTERIRELERQLTLSLTLMPATTASRSSNGQWRR